MKAKSIKGKNAEEIGNALNDVIGENFNPTLGVVFISIEDEVDRLRKLLSGKGIQIFGASTGSEFVDGDVETDSIAILLMDIRPENFRLISYTNEDGHTKEISEKIARGGLDAFNRPAFLILSGGLTADGDEIVEGIENVCGKGTTIFGGLAADKLLMQRTYVFTNDKFTDNGLLALVVDEQKIKIHGVAVGGWKPMGMERIITSSQGNIVYTIDNEPALDFITRYAGFKETIFGTGVDFILSHNFQLQLKRENKHPVMRTPMQANVKDRSITFAGSLPQGSKVQLCLLPGFEVVDLAISEFSQYKNEHPQADALIMFSCAGRQITLGPYVSEEINGVKNIWNVPMAGFFCYGEIGRVASGEHEFHNMTCSLAVLNEN